MMNPRFVETRKAGVALFCLLLVQLLLYVLVYARGDFPINDDWAYTHSVQWWFEEGRIRLSNWIAMNLLPQTLLGAAASYLFGFSFDTLRGLTQGLALVTSIFLFFWFRALSLSVGVSFLASLFLVITPWWGVLANSYMTEFYAWVFIIPALTLYVSLLSRTDAFSYGKWALATLLLMVAMLERQTTLVFPVAFGLAYWWRTQKADVKTLVVAVLPITIVLVAEILYQHYLKAGPGIPAAQQEIHGRLWALTLPLLKGDWVYVSWFGAKLAALAGDLALGSVLLALFCWGWQRWRSAMVIVPLACLFFLLCFRAQWWPPYHENNVLDRFGMGPLTVHGGLLDAYGALDRSPNTFWVGVGAFVCLSAAIILATFTGAVVRARHRLRKADPVNVFLFLALAGYFVPFLIADFFDRYVFFILPLFYGLLARAMSSVPPQSPESPGGRWATVAITSIATLTVCALSTSAVHDYFSWQKARWAAIRQAESLGGTAMTIDGGFEYNGFYRFEANQKIQPAPGKSFWWIDDDHYIVTMWPVPGYQEVKSFPIDRWLSSTPKEMLLLERQTPHTQVRHQTL